MYRIKSGSEQGLPDVTAFIDELSALDRHPAAEVRGLFDPGRELFVARAPGRLDVMGGIADYSGSLVLEMPIFEATIAALQRDQARKLTIISLGEVGRTLKFEMPLSDFDGDSSGPVDYGTSRAYFQCEPASHWASYVAGVFLVMMRERHINFQEGARILISSSVPHGKGVSSSAALEVAVMQAAATAFQVQIEPRDIALLCQTVENLVVGAPCGVMDQMTAVCGKSHRLLALLCQPAEIRGIISIPNEVAFWGIDSGVRHLVSGEDYSSVRTGAFMGYRIIAELAGLITSESAPGKPLHIEDPNWGGYLANVTPAEFEQKFAAQLPEHMGGREFVTRYRGTTDPVTRVGLERNYALRVPTAHAIYEHHRVSLFAELLAGDVNERSLEALGELMYQSHTSYSSCGLGSEQTDLLVQLVREAGPAQGLYGAKITGGGSGGTVAVLGRRNSDSAVEKLADRYARETGYRPHVFAGSSPGSAEFGYLELEKA